MQIANGTYDLRLFVGGVDLLNLYNIQLNKLVIYENLYDGLPTMSLSFTLPKDIFDLSILSDGTLLDIQLTSKGLEIKDSYLFRIWNVPTVKQDNNLLTVELGGVLDVYSIYQDGNVYNIFASTGDIFTQIAQKNNWTADIDNTQDRQLWVAGCRNLYQFMHHMAKYAYVDDTSFMIWYFDKTKRLIYKNFDKLLKAKSDGIWTFTKMTGSDYENKIFGYLDAEVSLTAGTDNIINGGYSIDFDVFDLLTYQNTQIHPNKVVAESAMVNISKELSKGLNYDWFPFNVGNFYDKYYFAYAQNKRIKATYSTYTKLTCNLVQKFRLGEVVNVINRSNGLQNNQNKLFTMLGFISSIETTIVPECITSVVTVLSQGMETRSSTSETY